MYSYLNFNQVDWLHKSWSSTQNTSIEASSGSWNDLTTSTMDGISMKRHVMDVKSHTSHVLLAKCTLQQINVIIHVL